jgi:hypothetical protein
MTEDLEEHYADSNGYLGESDQWLSSQQPPAVNPPFDLCAAISNMGSMLQDHGGIRPCEEWLRRIKHLSSIFLKITRGSLIPVWREM